VSKARIWQMLQECLDGYEAGLTPEECLSAYNGDRAELEVLLRQALSLRVAYACTPSEEFRHQAREKLMFAAGRDVKLALSGEPNPNFILQERTRFLNVAGATGQEALRDVPPPRLAFWVNARRRLLEAASNTTPAPARRFGNALRYSLSAGIVAAVIAVAAVLSLGGHPADSADAQLAALEAQVTQVELLSQHGQPVSGAQLDNLASLTTQITETLNDEPDLERADKIGGLILRQQEVVKQVTTDEPELAQAQAKLTDARAKLDEFAALVASPTVAAAVVAPTDVESSSPTPEATAEPKPTPTREPIADGEYRRALVQDDDTSGLTWEKISTSTISFLVPTNWHVIGLGQDQNGVAILEGQYIRIDTDGAEPIIIIISPADGSVNALIQGNPALLLRGPGPDGETIAPETLVGAVGDVGIPLHHFVLSINVSDTP
jgi:hypothetical protein